MTLVSTYDPIRSSNMEQQLTKALELLSQWREAYQDSFDPTGNMLCGTAESEEDALRQIAEFRRRL